jgi:uncharacterized GH25 family protein
VIKGRVYDSRSGVANAKIEITYSVSDLKNPVATELMKSVTVKKMTIAADSEGNYVINVPGELAKNPAVRIGAVISQTGYLTRTIPTLPLSDFDKQRFANDEAYWLHRQMSKSQFLSCRLKKAERLAGRILLPDGKPAVGAKVIVRSKYKAYSWKFHNPQEYRSIDTQITNDKGEFTASHEKAATLAVMFDGEATLLVDNLSKHLSANDPNKVVEFKLPLGHIVSGKIVDSNGNPIFGAVVEVQRHIVWNEFDMPLSYFRSVATNEKGEYRIAALPSYHYKFNVRRKLKDLALAINYDRQGPLDTKTVLEPIDDVFIEKQIEIKSLPTQRLDFVPIETAKIEVFVEFPPAGRPTDGRVYDLTIQGRVKGKSWSGTAVRAGKDGKSTLRVPIGAEDAWIGTGLARHRRTPNGPLNIGTVVHLGKITGDVTGIHVIEEELAQLKVKLKLGEEHNRNKVFIRINAFHAEKGVVRQKADMQKLYLINSMQTGKTGYRGQALPNEEIILQVRQTEKGESDKLLYEQRLTFKPGEKSVIEVDLTK